MMTCSKELRFCCAHRLLGHEGRCANLHGHNYKVLLTFTATEGVDSVGRVVDFSTIKTSVGGWLDNYWDHKTLVYIEDKELMEKLKDVPGFTTISFNPTAENMASYLFNTFRALYPSNINLIKVTVYETETSYATYV